MKLGSLLPRSISGGIFDQMEYAHKVGLDYLQVGFWEDVSDDHLKRVKQTHTTG